MTAYSFIAPATEEDSKYIGAKAENEKPCYKLDIEQTTKYPGTHTYEPWNIELDMVDT